MPATINPIRKAKVKAALLQGKSAIQAQIEAGYSPATAHNSTNSGNVKQCMKEISQEINKSDLVNKAFKVLEKKLKTPKASDAICAAANILRFAEGEIQNNMKFSPNELAEIERLRAGIVNRLSNLN